VKIMRAQLFMRWLKIQGLKLKIESSQKIIKFIKKKSIKNENEFKIGTKHIKQNSKHVSKLTLKMQSSLVRQFSVLISNFPLLEHALFR
jgi:hypothetical protein